MDAFEFRRIMGHWTTGVAVVATRRGERPWGLTANAFASVSLDPPLVLVCVEKTVKSHDAIAAAGKFAVSILGAGQADVSNRFASRVEDKFEGIAVSRGTTGVPLISEAPRSPRTRLPMYARYC